jgi:hypothetical protein
MRCLYRNHILRVPKYPLPPLLHIIMPAPRKRFRANDRVWGGPRKTRHLDLSTKLRSGDDVVFEANLQL